MSKLQKVVPASEIRKHLSKTAKRIWCPGCGTSIALGGMIRAMVESKIPEEAFAVITGIGVGSDIRVLASGDYTASADAAAGDSSALSLPAAVALNYNDFNTIARTTDTTDR